MSERRERRRQVAPESLGPSPDLTDGADDILAIILDRYDAVEEDANAGGEFVPAIAPEKLESLLGTANPTERSIIAAGRRLIRAGERALLADIARELGIDSATARQSVGRLAKRAGIPRKKPKYDRPHDTERATLGEHTPRIDPDSLDTEGASDASPLRRGPWTAYRADEAAHSAPQRVVSAAEYHERKAREAARAAARGASHPT